MDQTNEFSFSLFNSGNTSIQFDAPKEQIAAANKGHFVKKSFTSTLGNSSNFQFNFPIDAMEKLSIHKPNMENGKNYYQQKFKIKC